MKFSSLNLLISSKAQKFWSFPTKILDQPKILDPRQILDLCQKLINPRDPRNLVISYGKKIIPYEMVIQRKGTTNLQQVCVSLKKSYKK